ncbi:MAG: hypothetical protein AAFO84_08870 [Cyanobacteria bacterium J06598_1]
MVLGNVLNSKATPQKHGRDRLQTYGRNRKRRTGLIAKYAKQSLTTLIAFAVAAGLLGQIIPSPPIPSNIVFVGPKNDYYQAHKDDYNVLFFGSSRIYNQVIPEVFDATANQSAGLEAINSYNFGVPAMRAIDSAVLLEDVLADPPENLRWVFFESILDKGYEPIPNARTYRAMYWHDWENTKFAADYIFTSDESLPKKVALFGSHLLPFLYNHMNVGRLFNQVLPHEFSAEERIVAAEFTAQEGFYALREESDPKRQAFLADQVGYQAAVSELGIQRDPTTEDAYLSANKKMLLARITQTIRAAGAEPIFVEPPSLHPENDFQAAKALGTIDTLLSYKKPSEFPQLYAPTQRHDADHLNETGAREFTQLLAQDFREAIK